MHKVIIMVNDRPYVLYIADVKDERGHVMGFQIVAFQALPEGVQFNRLTHDTKKGVK